MKKIYFVSDAHLGARHHGGSRQAEKKLAGWLDSIRCDAAAVYFLGDMFDYWFEYRYVVPKGFVRFLGKLAELADQGIEIHIFTGNHDVWMFDYLTTETGAVVHRDTLNVELLGKRFFLGHGDEVGRRSLMFRLIRAIFRNRLCQRLYAAIHPRWTFGFARWCSLKSRLGGLNNETGGREAWGYLADFASEYLREHPGGADFFIFGHRHIMLDMHIAPSARLLIAGDWMKYFSYIVWDGLALSLLTCDSTDD